VALSNVRLREIVGPAIATLLAKAHERGEFKLPFDLARDPESLLLVVKAIEWCTENMDRAQLLQLAAMVRQDGIKKARKLPAFSERDGADFLAIQRLVNQGMSVRRAAEVVSRERNYNTRKWSAAKSVEAKYRRLKARITAMSELVGLQPDDFLNRL
jgi:hypothetical protein